jgi:integrase
MAREAESQLRQDLKEAAATPDAPPPPPPITLGEAHALYLEDYRSRKGKGTRQYESIYKARVAAEFGDTPLHVITVAKIEALLRKTREAGLSEKTVFSTIDILSRIFRFAIRFGLYAGYNPCQAVRKPKVNNRRTSYLTKDQIDALLAVLRDLPDRNFANLVRFLLFTGCRQGEAFKLEWGDVDLERRLIHLRDPKGGVDQTLPINREAGAALTDQKSRAGEEPFVFPGDRGGRRNIRPWRRWFEVRKAAGIPATFRLHDLRHTFASWLASSGKVDMQTLQALLTHKDSRTTMRYAHLFPEQLRRGAEVFDEIVDEGE